MGVALPGDEQILVLLPTTRDGERTLSALADAGLRGRRCGDLAELCAGIVEGAGLALLSEEALANDRAGRILEALRAQPQWSDLPLVLLGRERPTRRPEVVWHELNVSVVERPVRFRSLLTVIRAALRSRRHQYAVRDHMLERERHAAALRENEDRLRFALDAGRLGSWDLDLVTGELTCSARCRQAFGRGQDEPFGVADLLAAVAPEEQDGAGAQLADALARGVDVDVELQTVAPGGPRWVLVRGRARDAGRMTGVTLDVTDRRRAEDSLRSADRQKDEFLALLAHELRNPLAPIRNGLQILQLSPDPATRERVQRVMDRQLGHMVRLIDDLLDVSRISRNKMALRIGRVALADVVESAAETARPAILAAEQRFDVDLPAAPVFLDGDLTRLAQVFANLLSNSAKYTAPGGRIRLAAEVRGDEVVVTVRDTGIGIPAEAMPTLFDMFSQVDRSIERSTGGLGIGLALVRGLVEMHGGTVSAESDGPGRGSTFTVRLPRVRDRGGVAPSDPPVEAPDRRRILVVDDNRDSADSLAEMLRLLGHEVEVAHDGEEGVARAGRFRPDLVLMDIAMPRLNGFDATRRIRQEPWGRAMPVVALTGWGQDVDQARSSAAGCDGHLVKPVSLDDLSRVLATCDRR